MSLYVHGAVFPDISFIVSEIDGLGTWQAKSYHTQFGETAENDCTIVFDNSGQGFPTPEHALLTAMYPFDVRLSRQWDTVDDCLRDRETLRMAATLLHDAVNT